jgi:hypothetical protein
MQSLHVDRIRHQPWRKEGGNIRGVASGVATRPEIDIRGVRTTKGEGLCSLLIKLTRGGEGH